MALAPWLPEVAMLPARAIVQAIAPLGERTPTSLHAFFVLGYGRLVDVHEERLDVGPGSACTGRPTGHECHAIGTAVMRAVVQNLSGRLASFGASIDSSAYFRHRAHSLPPTAGKEKRENSQPSLQHPIGSFPPSARRSARQPPRTARRLGSACRPRIENPRRRSRRPATETRDSTAEPERCLRPLPRGTAT